MKVEPIPRVPPREEVLAELSRVVNTRGFRESHHLKALLTYVVTETLGGRESELKEYNLGVNALHRRPDYDPRTDAIVRVQVSQLRKKLQSLYESEPGNVGFRIEIPKGSYVPAFPAQVQEAPVTEASAPVLPAPPRSRFWLGLLAGAALMGLAVWITGHVQGLRAGSSQPVPALWAPILNSGVPAIVGFGVPLFYAGRGLYVRDVQVNEPGKERSSGIETVGRAVDELLRPQEDVYTGIGVSVGTYDVGRFLERHGIAVQVANSHYLGPSDIRGKNLVIVSSARFQTPLKQFGLPEAFQFEPQDSGGYSNPNPQPGELSFYPPKGSGATGVSTSYATICVWPGTSPERRLMLISGISSWYTLAAARFALDPKSQADLERRFAADPPSGPRGRKGPYYQILIRTEGKYDQVRSYEYVAHRYLDARPIRTE